MIRHQYRHESSVNYTNWKKGEIKPKEDTEFQKKFFELLDWTDTLITEAEKQAVEDVLVE